MSNGPETIWATSDFHRWANDCGKLLKDHVDRCGTKYVRADLFDAQAAEIARLSADPWQPIETAPQDGTVFLYAQGQVWLSTYCPNDPEFDRPEDEPYWRMVHLSEDASEGYSIDLQPTHWMPLPAPPK